MTIVQGGTGDSGSTNHGVKADCSSYWLDLTLYPQRSLKPEHFSRLLLVLIIICTLASIRFLIVGAWPVVLFLGADILALWFAFFLSYRRGRVFETIQLSDRDLIISACDATGKLKTVRFEPYWVTVAIKSVGADKNILVIQHRDKAIELGRFLVPHERHEVATAIKCALERWRGR